MEIFLSSLDPDLFKEGRKTKGREGGGKDKTLMGDGGKESGFQGLRHEVLSTIVGLLRFSPEKLQ